MPDVSRRLEGNGMAECNASNEAEAQIILDMLMSNERPLELSSLLDIQENPLGPGAAPSTVQTLDTHDQKAPAAQKAVTTRRRKRTNDNGHRPKLSRREKNVLACRRTRQKKREGMEKLQSELNALKQYCTDLEHKLSAMPQVVFPMAQMPFAAMMSAFPSYPFASPVASTNLPAPAIPAIEPLTPIAPANLAHIREEKVRLIYRTMNTGTFAKDAALLFHPECVVACGGSQTTDHLSWFVERWEQLVNICDFNIWTLSACRAIDSNGNTVSSDWSLALSADYQTFYSVFSEDGSDCCDSYEILKKEAPEDTGCASLDVPKDKETHVQDIAKTDNRKRKRRSDPTKDQSRGTVSMTVSFHSFHVFNTENQIIFQSNVPAKSGADPSKKAFTVGGHTFNWTASPLTKDSMLTYG